MTPIRRAQVVLLVLSGAISGVIAWTAWAETRSLPFAIASGAGCFVLQLAYVVLAWPKIYERHERRNGRM